MFFDIHTHHFCEDNDVQQILNCYAWDTIPEKSFFSKSVHPWYIHESSVENELNWLLEDVHNPNYLAIGECGLDKKCTTNFDFQYTVFEKQLIIAQQLSKPVIIHCVGAFQEILEIKKKNKITVPLIIHGFSKSFELAKEMLHHGFLLSFGHFILNSEKLRMILKNIPPEMFFLETDDKKDLDIKNIYNFVQELLDFDMELLMTHNFNKIFNQKFVK